MCNLIVKNLKDSVNNTIFLGIFSAFGEVCSSRVVIDPKSGKCVGYGYVQYVSTDVAINVVEKATVLLFS